MAEATVKEYYTPADRWLDILNKKYPNIWAYLKKKRESMFFDIMRMPKYSYLKDTPSWLEMPAYLPNLLIETDKSTKYESIAFNEFANTAKEHLHDKNVFKDSFNKISAEITSLAGLYLWRKTKGVYRFSKELYDTIINQPFDGDMPAQAFYHMPEWAVYIETPGMQFTDEEIEGFIAHIDYHINNLNPEEQFPCLMFYMFIKNKSAPYVQLLPLKENSTLKECVDELCNILGRQETHMSEMSGEEYDLDIGNAVREIVVNYFKSILNLLLYLCSEEPDIVQRESPIIHTHKREKGNIPKEPRVWDVGVRISHVLKKYKVEENAEEQNDGNETGTTVRPHIRRAHWHSYWVGPREEVYPIRKIIIKWLPPIPVNVRWQDELPVNIKLVDEDSNL